MIAACLFISGCGRTAETPSDGEKKKASAASEARQLELNDTARFIAGLPLSTDSVLAKMSTLPAWRKYADSFNKNWMSLDKSRMASMRKWAGDELRTGSNDNATVFYPFSGPDFLHAATFFPKAGSYVLVALEPVGTAPDIQHMTPDSMDQYFSAVNRSLQEVLSFSFFKTDNMKVDLKEELNGSLPILMIFLARTENRIDDIQFVEISDTGDVVTPDASRASGSGRKPPKGVDITFRSPDGVEKHLYYFSVNLRNDDLKRSPAFMTYLAKLGTVTSYLKSASYLMYKDYFSTIRGAILDQSALVVQDDSGIPYGFFKPDKWDVALYGVYSKPIEMFVTRKDEQLVRAYQTVNARKPLPFGIGYNWRQGQSNLLVARKKTGK